MGKSLVSCFFIDSRCSCKFPHYLEKNEASVH